MSEASLPFRPRPREPHEVSIDAVRGQMLRLRRRSNAFVAQQALYLTVSASLLGLSLLVALAFVLSRVSYAVVTWLTLFSLLALATRIVLRVRRGWIPGRDAAVAIDRRAVLEDRLATLVVADPASRLWGYLLNQNVRLLPRWEPRRMVPQAVPRSVWLLALAAASMLIVLYRSSVSLPGIRSLPGGAAGESPETTPGEEPSRGDSPSTLTSLFSELPERLREAIRRSAAKTPGEAAAAAALARGPGQAPPAGAATTRGQADRPIGPAPPGAKPSSTVEAPLPDGATGKRSTAPRRPPGGGDPNAAAPLKGEGPKALTRVETGRPRSAKPEGADKPKAGSGGARGAGSGGDGEGLFGPREGSRQAAGTFSLDLTAENIPGPGEAEGDPSARPAGELAADQRLDDAIRRAQVPAEYEQIVQRIFGRGEEPATGADEARGTR